MNMGEEAEFGLLSDTEEGGDVFRRNVGQI
jgi:hypothetical protein